MVVAEEARSEFHDAPDLTPALFGQLLPFAMALEIEANWSNQLSSTLKHAGYDPVLDEGSIIIDNYAGKFDMAEVCTTVSQDPGNGGSAQ